MGQKQEESPRRLLAVVLALAIAGAVTLGLWRAGFIFKKIPEQRIEVLDAHSGARIPASDVAVIFAPRDRAEPYAKIASLLPPDEAGWYRVPNVLAPGSPLRPELFVAARGYAAQRRVTVAAPKALKLDPISRAQDREAQAEAGALSAHDPKIAEALARVFTSGPLPAPGAAPSGPPGGRPNTLVPVPGQTTGTARADQLATLLVKHASLPDAERVSLVEAMEKLVADAGADPLEGSPLLRNAVSDVLETASRPEVIRATLRLAGGLWNKTKDSARPVGISGMSKRCRGWPTDLREELAAACARIGNSRAGKELAELVKTGLVVADGAWTDVAASAGTTVTLVEELAKAIGTTQDKSTPRTRLQDAMAALRKKGAMK